ncbi:MAG: proline--tRNA ligase [bacterium]|nr:proline--tRNA ligase [bacterium]
MLYSQIFGKTLRQPPRDAETVSHKYLVQAGYIDQLVAGVYSLLPLGLRVQRRIETIIREEMLSVGAQEVLLPALQPKSLWEKTGRWKTIDPPLFTVKDRHSKELALASTHEEVITDLVRRFISSYKELPLSIFQIQTKFRNEMRSTGGLLRVREFLMKDLYSFHLSEIDLDRFYEQVIAAYKRIYARCGLEIKVAEASGGTIGGKVTHEFTCLADTGEDKVVCCQSCDWAANFEVGGQIASCPKCGAQVKNSRGIEVGHIFKLGQKYAEDLDLSYTDKLGKKQFVWMGCYGIGIGRLLATVVEAHHDERGIIWPPNLSPFPIHLLTIPQKDEDGVLEVGRRLYSLLEKAGLDALFDDREDVSAGIKLKDADLIGIPVRVVVSQKSLARGGVEFSRRDAKEADVIPVEKLAKKIREVYILS